MLIAATEAPELVPYMKPYRGRLEAHRSQDIIISPQYFPQIAPKAPKNGSPLHIERVHVSDMIATVGTGPKLIENPSYAGPPVLVSELRSSDMQALRVLSISNASRSMLVRKKVEEILQRRLRQKKSNTPFNRVQAVRELLNHGQRLVLTMDRHSINDFDILPTPDCGKDRHSFIDTMMQPIRQWVLEVIELSPEMFAKIELDPSQRTQFLFNVTASRQSVR